MKTQFDHPKRVVALSNLNAMCQRVSSTCHRYWIEKVAPNRVYVGYSNPNEYGTENPMIAVFPAYHCDERDPVARAVVLDILGVKYDNWDGEGWQAFQVLLDCPVLWRSNPDTNNWSIVSLTN